MPRSPRKQPPPSGGYVATVTSGVLISLAVTIALLAHIRLKDELHRIESGISQLEEQLIKQKRENDRLQNDYDVLVSSDGLNKRLREMRLNLVMPGDGARVVLAEPTVEAPKNPPAVRDRTEVLSFRGIQPGRAHHRP